MTTPDNRNPWRGKIGPWGPRERVRRREANAAVGKASAWLQGREAAAERAARGMVCLGLAAALAAVAPAILGAGAVLTMGVFLFVLGAVLAYVLKLQRGVRHEGVKPPLRGGASFWASAAAMMVGLLWLASLSVPAPSPAPAEIAPAQRSLAE